MAQPQTDLTAILAALAANRPSATPAQSTPQPVPSAGYPGVVSAATPSNPMAGIPLPQPSNSGSLDLSSIKPSNTGSVSLADAIAKARGIAEKAGAGREDPRLAGRGFQRRSRSRSPARRENFRDGFNPYRDERRDDSRRAAGGRERSFSPKPQYQPQPQMPQGYPPQNGGNLPPPGGDSGSEVITVDSSSVGLIIGRGGENLRRVEGETGARVQFITGPDSNSTQRQCRISGTFQQRSEAKREIFRVAEENPKAAGSQAPLAGAAGRNQAQAANAQPPLREGEKSLQIMVPDRTVGLIIGRGGETIRDLQERSGCHVNIVGETKSINGLRPVNLIGTHAAAMKAKELILEVVESDTRTAPNASQSRDSGRGGYDPYAVQPPPVAASPYGQPPPQQYMYGGPPVAAPMPGGDRINETIQVPSEAVGMIIGKGGETIKDMQNTTGCKINVSPPSGADIQRDIGLVGSRNSIEAAKRAIWDKVGTVREKQGGGRRGPPQSDPVPYGDPYAQHAPSYGQPAPGPMAQQSMPPAVGPEAADPYAAYGGYQNYMAMWYAALANQGQGGGPPPV